MLTLLRAFWDISLFRRGPEHLPTSRFFLGVAALLLIAAESLVVLSLYPLALLVPILLTDLALLAAWTAASLAWARQLQRFEPTLAALFGCSAVLQLLSYPISIALDLQQRILPLVLILLWSIAIYAHILARATGWSVFGAY